MEIGLADAVDWGATYSREDYMVGMALRELAQCGKGSYG